MVFVPGGRLCCWVLGGGGGGGGGPCQGGHSTCRAFHRRTGKLTCQNIKSSSLPPSPAHSYGLQDSEDEADADEAPKKKRRARNAKEPKSPQSEKVPKLARVQKKFTAAEVKARAEKRKLTAIEVGGGCKRSSTATPVGSPPWH